MVVVRRVRHEGSGRASFEPLDWWSSEFESQEWWSDVSTTRVLVERVLNYTSAGRERECQPPGAASSKMRAIQWARRQGLRFVIDAHDKNCALLLKRMISCLHVRAVPPMQ